MSSRLSRIAVCCLLLASFCGVALGQASAGAWLRTAGAGNAVSTGFESLVFAYIDSSGRPGFRRQENLDLPALKARLRELKSANGKTPLVVNCTMPEYLAMLKDPEWHDLLGDLRLDLLNPRMFTLPFFLLQQKNVRALEKEGNLEVAWIAPDTDLQPVEDADLLTMLSETLGRPKNTLKVVRERGAYPAAKKLHEGNYGLVGIYEDEPSALLNEFTVNWEQELKADPVDVFPYDPRRVSPQLVPVVPGRFGYAFFSYSGMPFGPQIPDQHPVAAIVQEMEHSFPILLSNIRHLERDESGLDDAISFACFLMPSSGVIRSIPPQQRRRIEQMYLLNSYLEDPASRPKSLGLLGSLLLKKEETEGGEKAQAFGEKCEVFQRHLNLSETTAAGILRWLGMEVPSVGKRELFSSDVSRLYEDALRDLDAAIQAQGQARLQKLERARKGLVAALLQGSTPKNVQGSRGLWSVANYNPYYQIARVALYLQMEKRGGK